LWHNTSKALIPLGKTPLASLKFAKGLFGKQDDPFVFMREVGHLIEIIPQGNPSLLKPNDQLKVLVKFKGKPLPNAELEITDDGVLTTEGQKKYQANRFGIAQVPVRMLGLNIVSVDYKHPNDGSLGRAFKALPVETVMMVATYAFRL
jgi:nickel transport protein